MDIGAKIRDARVKSGLTQEQAAEALSVSRQTISNWEKNWASATRPSANGKPGYHLDKDTTSIPR